MLEWIKQLLKSPVFEDEDQTRVAGILNTTLLFILIALILITPVATGVGLLTTGQPAINLAASASGVVLIIMLLAMLRRGYVQAASLGISLTILLLVTMTITTSSSVLSPLVGGYIIAVIIAGLFLGGWSAIGIAALSVALIAGVIYAESVGRIAPPPPPPPGAYQLLLLAFMLTFTALLMRLTVQGINDTLKRLRESNQELEAIRASLEIRVAERTRALATSAEVSRSISTILDLRQLLVEVVEQIQRAFNYYHVHIYLLDEDGQMLAMASGTGEAGRQMLANHHKIPKGKGLVGQAASSNQPVLIPDVAQAKEWLPNPLLPNTKAEIAVPITIGDQVLGVLDIQHDVTNGVDEEDAELLQSVANQIAVALRNARIFEQTQQQAEQAAVLNRINQKIQMATDVEAVLQIAVQELGQTLNVPKATIHIGNQPSTNGRN